MNLPQRIQLSRRRGYRKPEGAIVVARPTAWGNPFRVEGATDRATAVRLFRVHAIGAPPFTRAHIRKQLAGHDLACWCPLDEPCHADVLLEIANGAGD